VRRGIDPRRFALLSFGGAAGLHVTDIARQLDLRRVVVPRLAAVLSAWGMLATDLRYEVARTHVGDTSALAADDLRRIFHEMEAEGRRRLSDARFEGPVHVRRSADMRYGEQIFEIGVGLSGVDLEAPDVLEQIATRFHARHEELYAYSAPGQEVVVVNARVAVIGELDLATSDLAALAPPDAATLRAASAPRRRRVYLGEWTDVAVHRLDALTPGEQFKGPAVFESATTTVLVREGEHVTVTPHGWLDIRLT
jgi:N-methylhydantoinase A